MSRKRKKTKELQRVKPDSIERFYQEKNELRSLASKFFEWTAVLNYSQITIRNRQIYLASFIIWLEERGIRATGEVTKPILDRYQRYLFHQRKRNGEPLSFRTQFSHLIPIRAFFKWLAKSNHILYNPASELELPKLEKRLPKHVLTISEAERILNGIDITGSMGLRDRAILETFYSTGIRRSELINIRVYDLDVERGTLMIRQGKGKKDRMVPIGERAIKWVEKYMYEVRPGLAVREDEKTIFLTKAGEKFESNSLSILVREYVIAADIGKIGSCHLFRHTMATLMLEGGADVRYIQAMLGHAKLETTQIYTQVSIRKLKEIHDLTHPAKLKAEKGEAVRKELEEELNEEQEEEEWVKAPIG